MIYLTVEQFTTTVPGVHHVATDWQIASDVAFENILEDNVNDTVNLVTYLSSVPATNQPVYGRARFRLYKGTEFIGFTNWSVAAQCEANIDQIDKPDLMFICSNDNIARPIVSAISLGINIQTPELSLGDGTYFGSGYLSIVGSDFIYLTTPDTHFSTDWKIFIEGEEDIAGATPIYESIGDNVNLTELPIPPSTLYNGVNYTVLVRYNGTFSISEVARYSFTVSNNSWIKKGQIPLVLNHPTFLPPKVVELDNNELFIVAWNPITNGDYYRYNLATDTLTSVSNPFPGTGQAYFAAIEKLFDGRIMSSDNNGLTAIYDPGGDIWNTVASHTVNNITQTTLLAYNNDDVYFLSTGKDVATDVATGRQVLNYNISTNTWSNILTITDPGVVSPDTLNFGLVYSFIDDTSGSTVFKALTRGMTTQAVNNFVLSPGFIHEFTPLNNVPTFNSFDLNIDNNLLVTIPPVAYNNNIGYIGLYNYNVNKFNNELIITGGKDNLNNVYNQTLKYDLNGQLIDSLKPLPVNIYNHYQVTLSDGTICIFGGFTKDINTGVETYNSDIYTYRP